MRSALAGLHVRDAMVAEPDSVEGDLTLAAFVSGPFARSRHAAYPVDSDGELAGMLHYRDVATIPPADWEHVRVRDAAVALDEVLVLAADAPLADALIELSGNRLGRGLVLDPAGRLEGLLSITDAGRLLELERTRVSGFPRSGSVVSTLPAKGARA
jgi:CBS domain-containing protein